MCMSTTDHSKTLWDNGKNYMPNTSEDTLWKKEIITVMNGDSDSD